MQKIKKQKHLIYLAIILPLFFGAVYFACASGLSTKMAPGTILNPVCAPGESNCTISQLAARGTSTGITAYNALTSANIGATNPLEALGIGGGIKQSGAVSPTVVSTRNQLLNEPKRTFISGHYLYVPNTGSDALLIYDISDPVNPVLTGSLVDDINMFEPVSVYVTSSYAYVVSSGTGSNTGNLAVIDVSNPSNPTMVGKIVGSTNLPGVKKIIVKNNFAFVSCIKYTNGGSTQVGSLAVFNVSDPANPTYVSKITPNLTDWTPDSFVISDHYAYVVTYMPGEMTTIDIASTTNMQVKSTVLDPLDHDSGGIAVRGNYVYFGHYWGGLIIVDVSSSTHPIVVGTLDNGSMHSTDNIVLSGNYAYMTSYYAPSGYFNSHLSVVDISSMTNPVLVKQIDTSATLGWPFDDSLVQFGNYLYADGMTSNIGIYDISDPVNPVPAGLIDGSDRLFHPAQIVVNNGYAYITNTQDDGISVFDVSNPQQPKFLDKLSSYNYHNPYPYFMTNPSQIAVNGHYAYVSMYDGFRVVDISNPAKLVIVGSLDDSNHLDGVVFGPIIIRGHYAYLNDFIDSTFIVIDIANPKKPVLVSSYSAGGNLTRPGFFTIAGKYAYITTMPGTLFVVDISNPANLSVAGQLSDSADFSGISEIVVRDRYAYITTGAKKRLVVVDISNPANPVFAARLNDSINFSGPAKEIINGNTLYVFNNGSSNQVVAVDISNPLSPKVISSVSDDKLLNLADADVEDGYAYMLGGYGSLSVVNLHSSLLTGVSAGNYTLGNLNLSGNANFSSSFSAKNYLNLAGSLSAVRSAVFGANILSINPNGNIGIGASGNNILNIDNQAGKSALQIGGKYPACLKLKGVSSWIYCSALNGVLSCGTSSCE
jgi:hypothetical protein